ncbi:hypothetical protein TNCV_676681 [Trichonephila clavipes]|nr:hypothetical protein TNCV_676681 [Trichonephila clavipes]
MWVVGISLVMNAFQSLLVTKLTLRKSQPYIDTMEDLLKTDKTIGIAPVEINFEEALEARKIKSYNQKIWLSPAYPGSSGPLDAHPKHPMDKLALILHYRLKRNQGLNS